MENETETIGSMNEGCDPDSEDARHRHIKAEKIIAARLKLSRYALAHSMPALLQKTLDEVCDLTDSCIGFYHFVEPDQKTLSLQMWSTRTLKEFCHAEGAGMHYGIEQAGVWVDCLRVRRPVIHNDYNRLAHKRGLPPGHAEVIRELVVPIFRGEKVVAILGVGNKPIFYDDDDIDLVRDFADLAWDIAEIKIAEKSLRRNQAILNATQALTKVGGWEWGLDSREMFWTDEVYKIYGYLPEAFAPGSKILVERSLEGFSPEDRAMVLGAFERCVQEGVPYDLESRFTKVTGERIWIRTIAEPIFKAGQVVKILGSIMDITEAKKLQEEMRTSERRLQAILEACPEPVVVYDLEGVPQYFNPAFIEVFGWTLEELKGKRIPFVPEDQKEITAAKIDELFKFDMPVRFLSTRLTKQGDTIEVAISAASIKGPKGERKAMVVNLTDISERLKLEAQLQQAQKMESIGRLAGGVAHDFNNMLGVILGHAELAMEQTEVSHPVYYDLQEIFNAAQRSADLTKQLLAFARRQAAAPKILDLNATIAGMLKMLRRIIGEDIDLVWGPAANLCKVKIDPVQLDQILANLCANARDAIDGVGKLTIETKNVSIDSAYCAGHAGFLPGDSVMLAVSDDGRGMDEETLENLFEPFYTTKGVGEGTGLGLATVYGIVKQNNGCINVYSEPGRGSTFKIYLPRVAAPVETKTEPTVRAVAKGTETVLVVEDEASILNLSTVVLERCGYSVLAAGLPSEALQLVARHKARIDLLITDVVMPEMNGQALKERVAELHPHISVLFMSGYTTSAIVHRGILEKDVHFIQKPFSVNALAKKVREVLDASAVSTREAEA